MNRHSSKELSQEEVDFYTEELDKIYRKWKPVIDNLSDKTTNNEEFNVKQL